MAVSSVLALSVPPVLVRVDPVPAVHVFSVPVDSARCLYCTIVRSYLALRRCPLSYGRDSDVDEHSTENQSVSLDEGSVMMSFSR